MVGETIVKDKPRLIVKPVGQLTGNKTMMMRAECSVCKNKIAEREYGENGDALHDFNLKRRKWWSSIVKCPHCGARFKAEKENKTLSWRNGNVVDAKNGRFEIFKWGHGYRWCFRYYNEREPRAENQGFAYVKETAQRACENHKEWMV